MFAARGTYHLTLLKDKNNKFDPYAGVMLGVRLHTYRNTYYDYADDSYDAGGVLPATGVFVGAKYSLPISLAPLLKSATTFPSCVSGLNFKVSEDTP